MSYVFSNFHRDKDLIFVVAPLYFGTEFFGTEYFGTKYFGTECFGTEYFGNWTFGTEYFGTWTFGTEYFGTQCKLALKSNYSSNS